MQPAVVALVGVTLYPIVCKRERGAPKLPPGPGAKPELIEGARLFVVPNPSGLNAHHQLDDLGERFAALRRAARQDER